MALRPAISAPLTWLATLAGSMRRKSAGTVSPLLKLPRSLSITREGKWYIGILLVIGVAAINTGNNLLYLVVATLLSLIIISGILSEATLRGVVAERSMPPFVFKGSHVKGTLRATNAKRLFASYSFWISEMDGQALKAYFLKLGPGQSAEVQTSYTFRKRGMARLTRLKVSTRFPFGLFIKSKEETRVDEVLVLPSIERRRAARVLKSRQFAGSRPDAVKGEGGGLYGLREYTLVDDSRHIHWKSAARSSRLLLKEFEDETERAVVVVFENGGVAGEHFEDLVDVVAGTINNYIEKGFAVGLKTRTSDISPAAGRDQLLALLKELALIKPDPVHGSQSPSVKVVSL